MSMEKKKDVRERYVLLMKCTIVYVSMTYQQVLVDLQVAIAVDEVGGSVKSGLYGWLEGEEKNVS